MSRAALKLVEPAPQPITRNLSTAYHCEPMRHLMAQIDADLTQPMRYGFQRPRASVFGVLTRSGEGFGGWRKGGQFTREQWEKCGWTGAEALSLLQSRQALEDGVEMLAMPTWLLPSNWVMLDFDDKDGHFNGELPPEISEALSGCFIERSGGGKGFHVFARVPQTTMNAIKPHLVGGLKSRRGQVEYKGFKLDIDYQVEKPFWLKTTGCEYGTPWAELDGNPKRKLKFHRLLEDCGLFTVRKQPETLRVIAEDDDIGITSADAILQLMKQSNRLNGIAGGLTKLIAGDREFIEGVKGGWSEADVSFTGKFLYYSRDYDTFLETVSRIPLTKRAQHPDPEKRGKWQRTDYAQRTWDYAVSKWDGTCYQDREAAKAKALEVQRGLNDFFEDAAEKGLPLIRDEEGNIEHNSPTNTAALLQVLPQFQQVFGKNELTLCGGVRKSPDGLNWPIGGLCDTHGHGARALLEQHGYKASKAVVDGAILGVTCSHPYNPNRDAMRRFRGVWDGKPRLKDVGRLYFGIEEGEFTDAEHANLYNTMIYKTLIAIVAKCMNPANPVHSVLILSGDSNAGKSYTVKLLAESILPEAHAELSERVCNMDRQLKISEQIIGKAVVELAECAPLNAHGNVEIEAVKAFVTRSRDLARLAYQQGNGGLAIPYPRSAVFIGTLNPQKDSGFLSDPTGGRRWWPCGVGSKIDTKGLARDLPQLWAEAIIAYDAGEGWELPEEMEQMQGEVMLEHTVGSPLDEFIRASAFEAMDDREFILKVTIATIHKRDGRIVKGGFTPYDLWEYMTSTQGRRDIFSRHVRNPEWDSVSKRIKSSLLASGAFNDVAKVEGKSVRGWFYVV